jgi:membrane protein implicated in regulation of membrane protease activity
VDVVSDGTFIDAGTAVTVTRVDGNRIVVRPLTHTGTEPSHD